MKGVSVLQISVKILGIYLQQLSGLSFQVIELALFCYAAVSKLLSIGTTYTRLEDAVNRPFLYIIFGSTKVPLVFLDIEFGILDKKRHNYPN